MIEHDWEKLGVLSLNTVQNNGFSVLSLKFGGNPQNCQSLDSEDYSFFGCMGGGGVTGPDLYLSKFM